MVYIMRNDNFAAQNVPAENLAEKHREVKGGDSDELEDIVAGAVEVKYEVGDMVWAKVKSYPWWPGQIFKEDWAVPSVRKTKKEGHVLVAFFGDSSFGWFDPKELLPFDPHYVEKSKKTKSPAFLDAVEDAEDEVSRRAALGLACPCNNLLSMRPINYFDCFYAVGIKGYDSSGVYSLKQMRSARDEFQPVVTLSFMRQLALMPGGKLQQNVDWIKNVAMVCAYRMAVFEEIDETCLLSYADQSENLSNSVINMEEQQEEVPYEGLNYHFSQYYVMYFLCSSLLCAFRTRVYVLFIGTRGPVNYTLLYTIIKYVSTI